MSHLAAGVGMTVVGEVLFEGDDGVTAVAWVRFSEEEDDAASAYRVLQGGKLESLDGVSCWGKWKAVAALAAEGG